MKRVNAKRCTLGGCAMVLFIGYIILSFQDVLDPGINLLRFFLLGFSLAIVWWLWKSRKNVSHPLTLSDDSEASLSDDSETSPRLTVEKSEDLRARAEMRADRERRNAER